MTGPIRRHAEQGDPGGFVGHVDPSRSEVPYAGGRPYLPESGAGYGGEPSSVAFCHGLGFDYVSCSPFRVPIARLAAAQAALQKR